MRSGDDEIVVVNENNLDFENDKHYKQRWRKKGLQNNGIKNEKRSKKRHLCFFCTRIGLQVALIPFHLQVSL